MQPIQPTPAINQCNERRINVSVMEETRAPRGVRRRALPWYEPRTLHLTEVEHK